MRPLPRTRRLIVLLAAIAGASGCAAPARLYVNSDADMSYYTKIAILPFTNLSGGTYAGERVSRTFVTELVIAERYEIVDPGQFRSVLDRIGGLASAEGAYDPKKLKQAAKEVGATGLIRGAVTEYEIQRGSGSDVPALAFDVEMIDVETEKIVWRASVSKRGKGRTPVLGGGGTRTLSRLTEESCRELVHELERKGF